MSARVASWNDRVELTGETLVLDVPSLLDDGECEFVKERTREERDEEGRANAISFDE